MNGIVYAVDSSGTAYAIRPTGKELWSTTVDVPTFLGPKVTNSPLVIRRRSVFGDQAGFVHGLDLKTGTPLWRVRPNPHDGAVIFASAIPVGNNVAIGTSSVEELQAASSGYRCCTFRGSVVLLNPANGRLIWQTFLVGEVAQNSDGSFGPSGSPVWSTPTYDRASHTVFVTTGNNYSPPATGSSDAIVALDASSGRIRWINQRTAGDIANVTTPPEDPNHPDYDFGDSPQVYRLGRHTIVGAGQKSGLFHAVRAPDGRLVNEIRVSPAGGLGGLFADSAVSDGTVYANGTDWPFVYAGGMPRGGNLSAISGDGSRRRWEFRTPKPNLSGVAVANGVVYFQSLDGFLYALDARRGKRLARLKTNGQFSGPAVSRGRVYLGTGDMLTSLFNPFKAPGRGAIIALGVRGR